MLFVRNKNKESTRSAENGMVSPAAKRKSAMPFLTAGFTVTELIVVMSIFAVLSGVVMFRFGDFTSNISLQNLAHDIALQVKRAQTDGSLGRNPNIAAGQNPSPFDWVPSFGLYFSTSNNDRFIYFFDRESILNPYDLKGLYGDAVTPSGNICSRTGVSECLDEIVITRGNIIEDICINEKAGNAECGLSELHITYTRPNLNATIRTGPTLEPNVISDAEIKILSKRGRRMTIVIWPVGQIAIEEPAT